jgi:2-polyprenyl-3-methyl-5-hydroxy-6-metoxy-1,4-benzoquinol methylase
MTENSEKPSEYFSTNAESWLSDAYTEAGYNYPTPFHRLRIVKNILAGLTGVNSVIDVGCGGGQLAVAVAEDGHTVCGVDQSVEMLANAKQLIAKMSPEIKTRVSLKQSSIENLGESDYDVLTCMGVIGYLESDEMLFRIAAKSIRPNGYFIASFRNRLFNLFSLSHRTLAEIKAGEFERLYKEASELYLQVDESASQAFLEQIHAISGNLDKERNSFDESAKSPSETKGQVYSSEFEARQTSPREARASAEKCGFDVVDLRAVHPHLAVPGLNKMLPPRVYNQLCDSLIPLEGHPLALLWSSVFIGVFQKRP